MPASGRVRDSTDDLHGGAVRIGAPFWMFWLENIAIQDIRAQFTRKYIGVFHDYISLHSLIV